MPKVVVAGSENSFTFAVIDFTTPGSPAVKQVNPGWSGGCRVAIDGQYVAAGNLLGGEVRLIDVSNPALPVLKGTINTQLSGIGAIAIRGTRVAVGEWVGQGNRIKLIDFSNPNSPQLMGTATTIMAMFRSISFLGNNAVVAAGQNDFSFVKVDFTNPANPVVTLKNPGFGAPTVDADSSTNRIVAGDRHGAHVKLYDAALSLLETVNLSGASTVPSIEFISLSGSLALAGSANGFYVARIDFSSSPPAVQVFNALTGGGNPTAIDGSLGVCGAYVGTQDVNLFDLAPAIPSKLGTANAGIASISTLGISSFAVQPPSSPTISVTSASLTFGGVKVNATAQQTFQIKNTGNAPLIVSGIQSSDPRFTASPSGPFTIQPANPPQSVAIAVAFVPNAEQSVSATLLITSNDPNSPTKTVTLSGSGILPHIAAPASHNFGSVPVGQLGSAQLAIRNTGGFDLTVSSISTTGPFGVASSGFVITPNATHNVNVTFAPIASGAASGSLVIVSDDPSHNATTIPLSGSGCVPNAEIVVPTAPFPTFGQVQRGFRMVRFVTVKNTGDAPLTFTARIDGADKTLFGLMQSPPNQSVVNVVNSRGYSVNPVSTCGSGAVGNGDITVAVVFFANAAPRITNAQLIIEGHNATNAAQSFTFALSAAIIAPVAVDAALVLDRSGSMADKIGTRKKVDAAVAGGKLFAELIRPDLDDRLTVVKYDNIIDVIQPIVSVTSANQPKIVATVNATELSPRGSTCIAGGVMVALDQLAVPRAAPPAALTKAMVVLTDGMDNTAYLNPADGQWYSILGRNAWGPAGSLIATQAFPIPSDVKIYGIALGKEEDTDKDALNRLSTTTGAYYGGVAELVGPDYFSLEKYFAQIYMDMINLSTISDPVYTIASGQQMKIEFDVLQGDVGALVVVFDYDGKRLPFSIITPSGEVIDGVNVPHGFQLRVGSTTTARFVEFLMPPGKPDRYAGRWVVIVEHRGEVCSGDVGGDRKSGFLPYECRSYKKPVDFGIAIGVGSNFRMQPYVTPAPVHVGDPILLTAVVTEAGLPVTDCTVTVRAVAPSGATWNLTLLDDGNHDDADSDDGEYARKFTQTAEAGTYEFTFRAVGLNLDRKPVVREAVRAKHVEGRITIENPPGEPDICCERLLELLEKVLDGKRSDGAHLAAETTKTTPEMTKSTAA